jgi:hypothetical protein
MDTQSQPFFGLPEYQNASHALSVLSVDVTYAVPPLDVSAHVVFWATAVTTQNRVSLA